MNVHDLGMRLHEFLTLTPCDNHTICKALSAILATRIVIDRTPEATDEQLVAAGVDLLKSHFEVVFRKLREPDPAFQS